MLLPSLEPTLRALDMIPAILQRVDTALYQRVLKAIRPPHFAAPAVMTWFAHDIEQLDKVAAIFDFLISSPPIMIFYLCAAVRTLNVWRWQKVILNSKPEILAESDEDEDEFAALYTCLVKLFRSQIPVTIVFPLAVQLFKDIPPDTLDVYPSLSEVSCYKHELAISSNWLEEGIELLQIATEEQYLKQEAETKTEAARRMKTLQRQEMADITIMKYLEKRSFAAREADEQYQKRLDIAKEEAIWEAKMRWKKIKEQRFQAITAQKDVLRQVRRRFEDCEVRANGGLTFWGIFITGTAIAGAAIAVLKGYEYI